MTKENVVEWSGGVRHSVRVQDVECRIHIREVEHTSGSMEWNGVQALMELLEWSRVWSSTELWWDYRVWSQKCGVWVQEQVSFNTHQLLRETSCSNIFMILLNLLTEIAKGQLWAATTLPITFSENHTANESCKLHVFLSMVSMSLNWEKWHQDLG